MSAPPPATPAVLAGNILVVDDTEANRDALARRLERRGYAVTTAEDGPSALALIDANDYDAVLLDVMMPGMSGLEVLEKIRQTRGPTDLPVIMATAKGETSDIVSALQLGANDYVTKPIDFAVALARVQTQLTLRQTVMENRSLTASLSHRNAELETANAKLTQYAQRTAKELQAAARVQRSCLPSALPQVEGVDFAWHFKPCTELAGDALSVVKLDSDYVGFYVLDVSGHGVAASLLAVAASRQLSDGPESILTKSLEQPDRPASPKEAIERLDSSFRNTGETTHFLTMFYGTYCASSRRLSFASAAHPPAILLRHSGEVVELESSGLPIGFGEGYVEQSLDLAPGDRILVYSDGVSEAMSPENELFGTDRIVQALQAIPAAQPLDDTLRHIEHTLAEWTNHQPERDDLTMLLLRIG